MPYQIRRQPGGGYKVIEGHGGKHPGRTFSKHKQTKAQAEAQRRAIEVNTHGK